MSSVTTVRATISTLTAEIADHESVGRNQDEARAAVAAHFAELAADGRRILGQRVSEVAHGGPAVRLLDMTGRLAEPVLAALLGPDLMGAFEPHLAALPPSLDRAARRARVTELRAELFQAEVDEEALIVEAKTRGEYIARRPDADCAAVLYMPPVETAP